ncbi:DadA Glycine/D-amino acid oxidases (deaminating) [actinobacterium SCGC AAA044-D11]
MTKAIVIGAGVIGCSIAFEMAVKGYEVTTVDKAQGPGQGSTSASSAVVRFNYSTFDAVALAWESFHCWKNWPQHLGKKQERYSKMIDVGVVMLDAPVISGEKTSQLFDAVGIPYKVWNSTELSKNITGIDAGKYWPPKRLDDEAFWEDAEESLGAIFTPNGGYIDDPLLATENLAQAAITAGVSFRFKSKVTAILKEGNKVIGVEVDGNEKILADIVVNAGGPWSNRINELAGVGQDFTITVKPMRQEVHQINTPMNLLPGPIIGDLDLGIYMRSTPTGSTLIGGTEPECDQLDWVDDVEAVNLNRTKELFEAQVTRAARRLPALKIPNSPSGIAGVYDVAADWTPIYDRTDLVGFFVAIGTSGNQFKNAPMVGKLMTELIEAVRAGKDHDIDPVKVRAERTGNEINLGAFSRKRAFNADNTGTVMG